MSQYASVDEAAREISPRHKCGHPRGPHRDCIQCQKVRNQKYAKVRRRISYAVLVEMTSHYSGPITVCVYQRDSLPDVADYAVLVAKWQERDCEIWRWVEHKSTGKMEQVRMFGVSAAALREAS